MLEPAPKLCFSVVMVFEEEELLANGAVVVNAADDRMLCWKCCKFEASIKEVRSDEAAL